MQQPLTLLNLTAVKDAPKTKSMPADTKVAEEKFQSALENVLAEAGVQEKSLGQLSAKAVVANRRSKERLGEEQEIKEIRGLKNIKDILLLSSEKKLHLKSLTVEIKQEGKPDSRLVIKTDDTETKTEEKSKPSPSPLKLLHSEPVEKNRTVQKNVTLDLKELLAKIKEEAGKKDGEKTQAPVPDDKKSVASEERAPKAKKESKPDTDNKIRLKSEPSQAAEPSVKEIKKAEKSAVEIVQPKKESTPKPPINPDDAKQIKQGDTQQEIPASVRQKTVADSPLSQKHPADTETLKETSVLPAKEARENGENTPAQPKAKTLQQSPKEGLPAVEKETKTSTSTKTEKTAQTGRPAASKSPEQPRPIAADTKTEPLSTPKTEEKPQNSGQLKTADNPLPKETATKNEALPQASLRRTENEEKRPEPKTEKEQTKTGKQPVQPQKTAKTGPVKPETSPAPKQHEAPETLQKIETPKEETSRSVNPSQLQNRPTGLSDLIRAKENKPTQADTAETKAPKPVSISVPEQKTGQTQTRALENGQARPLQESPKERVAKELPDAPKSEETPVLPPKQKKHTTVKTADKPAPELMQADDSIKEQAAEVQKSETLLKKEAPKHPTLGALLNANSSDAKKVKKESSEPRAATAKIQPTDIKSGLAFPEDAPLKEPESINRDFISKILSKNLSAGTAMTIDGGSQNSSAQSIAAMTPATTQQEMAASVENISTEQQTETIKHEEIRQESLKNRVATAKSTVSHFAQNLKEQVQEYKAPLMKITMDLNPKNLGSVGVTLLNRGKNLHVQIHSNPQAVQLFMQNNLEFKNALGDLGYKDVQLNFSFGQGSSSNHNGGGHREQELPSYFSSSNTNQNETEEMEIILPNIIYG